MMHLTDQSRECPHCGENIDDVGFQPPQNRNELVCAECQAAAWDEFDGIAEPDTPPEKPEPLYDTLDEARGIR